MSPDNAQPEAAMLFAAGRGTRMGALTADRPKPLIEVAGMPLLDHALAVARGANLRRIVVNAHYRATQIEAHLADRPGIAVSLERDGLLDSGGGLKAALPLLRADPVFTLNCDAVWTGPNPFATLAEAWDPSQMDALLLLVPPERAVGRLAAGDFDRAPDGRLRRGPTLVYTGAQILKVGRVASCPRTIFSLNGIWDEIGASGRLFGVVHPGHWADVGHPGGIALAEAMLAGGPG